MHKKISVKLMVKYKEKKRKFLFLSEALFLLTLGKKSASNKNKTLL